MKFMRAFYANYLKLKILHAFGMRKHSPAEKCHDKYNV